MAGEILTFGRETAIDKIIARKWSFLVVFLVVLFVSYALLSALDFVPQASVAEDDQEAYAPDAVVQPLQGELPIKIEIPAINLSASIANPAVTDAAVLDAELLKGAVRYPSSGLLGEEGKNVLLFGHSSYLPVVHNQAYKAFDDIQNLKKGDRITVYSNGRSYVYSVETVASASATRDAIPLTVTGSKLTLVTCDSFASKSDRFVVIANLVESNLSGN